MPVLLSYMDGLHFSSPYGGYSGYVVARYVAITADGGTCTVTTSSGSLNIRKTASTGATIIFTAAKDSTLRLLDNTSISGWYRVSNASGTGWGSSAYLTVTSNPGGGSTGDSDYIIECQALAKQTYGYRRVWLWMKQNKSVECHPLTVLHHMRKLDLLAQIRRRRPYTLYKQGGHR